MVAGFGRGVGVCTRGGAKDSGPGGLASGQKFGVARIYDQQGRDDRR